MSAVSRIYPHEKALVLNALYDALDAMGMKIAQSDSVRGTLLIFTDASGEKQLRITLLPDVKDVHTNVEINAADDCAGNGALSDALLDEIASTIKRTGLVN